MTDRPPLSRPLPAATISAAGLDVEVTASDAERTAIAGDFGILGVPSLHADLQLRRSGDKVWIDGHLTATVVQACVVTLDPVEQAIDLHFERSFVRGDSTPVPPEADIDPVAEDPPDTFAETIDLGAVVLEELALAIDPYPRAPGVEFHGAGDGDEDAPESPFAVLKTFGNREPT